jgi:hypothetical protein
MGLNISLGGARNNENIGSPSLLNFAKELEGGEISVQQFKLLDTRTDSGRLVCASRVCCKCSLSIDLASDEDVYYYQCRGSGVNAQVQSPSKNSMVVLLCSACYYYNHVFIDCNAYIRFYRSLRDSALQSLYETMVMLKEERMHVPVTPDVNEDTSETLSSSSTTDNESGGRSIENSEHQVLSSLLTDLDRLYAELTGYPEVNEHVLQNCQQFMRFLTTSHHLGTELVNDYILRQTTAQVADIDKTRSIEALGDCDTTICLLNSGKDMMTISAHSMIISARSSYFMVQLLGSWSNAKDKKSQRVSVHIDDSLFGDYCSCVKFVDNKSSAEESQTTVSVESALGIMVAAMYVVNVDKNDVCPHDDEISFSALVLDNRSTEEICLAWLLTLYFGAESTRKILTDVVCDVVTVHNVLYLIEWCDRLLICGVSTFPFVSSSDSELIRQVKDAACSYLEEHLVELALDVDCTSRFGLIAVSKDQIKRALESDFLQAEDELSVLHVVVGWDALQHHKYEQSTADRSDEEEETTNSNPFVSDLAELLLLVRFAVIPPDESLDLILSKDTYANFSGDHFLSRSATQPVLRKHTTGGSSSPAAVALDLCRQFWMCNFVVKKGIVSAANLMARYGQNVSVHRIAERTDQKFSKRNFPILIHCYGRFRPRVTSAHTRYITGVWRERERARANEKWAQENKYLFIIGAFHPLRTLATRRFR